MTQPLSELVEQFCHFQRKQRGKSDRGVKTYRWVFEQFLVFVKTQRGRMARAHDVSAETIQAWMDAMAAADLALETMRMRQSAVSSFCAWLVKRQVLTANPVARLDRPPHRREAPTQVPAPALMDALVRAARQRERPRDTALFLILRYTGMRRESVARLQVRHLDPQWGLHGVRVKGGTLRDIPLPSAVARYLEEYVEQVLGKALDAVTPETPLFWSTWGRRSGGKTRAPMTGQNVWRACAKCTGDGSATRCSSRMTSDTESRWRCWSDITTWKKSARCWGTRESTPPRSTPPFARRNLSERWPSTRRRRRKCSPRSRTRPDGFEKHWNVSRTRSRNTQQKQFGGPNGIRTRVWSGSRFRHDFQSLPAARLERHRRDSNTKEKRYDLEPLGPLALRGRAARVDDVGPT